MKMITPIGRENIREFIASSWKNIDIINENNDVLLTIQDGDYRLSVEANSYGVEYSITLKGTDSEINVGDKIKLVNIKNSNDEVVIWVEYDTPYVFQNELDEIIIKCNINI
jgi:hypothetical protein